MCCLKSKNIIGDSIILVYIVRVKIFEFDSPRTTTIASRRTQTLDKEVAQGNVKQRIEDQPRVALLPLSVPWRHTPKTRLTASKIIWGQYKRLPQQRAATSSIWFRRSKVNFYMSKSPNKYWVVLVTLGDVYKQFLVPIIPFFKAKTPTPINK